jgi:hypothetical protein
MLFNKNKLAEIHLDLLQWENEMKNLLLKKWLMIFFVLLYPAYSFSMNTAQSSPDLYCKSGSQRQLARSHELEILANADQADRQNLQNYEKDTLKIAHKDLLRRKRVGEIFGEGCIQNTKDYLNAALIYQHGDTSDHYYQAFIWSKRAAELGDLSGQRFSALAIDRYLISIGKKQLFGTQYLKMPPNPCYCMQPVEQSFSDNFRKEYSGRSLKENYQLMSSINTPDCPRTECQTSLQPTPKGSIIGFW